MDERDIYEQRSVYRDMATYFFFFKGFLSQVKDADMYKSVGVNFLLHLFLGFSHRLLKIYLYIQWLVLMSRLSQHDCYLAEYKNV